MVDYFGQESKCKEPLIRLFVILDSNSNDANEVILEGVFGEGVAEPALDRTYGKKACSEFIGET